MTIEELRDENKFDLLETINHDEILPFVLENLKFQTLSTRIFKGGLIASGLFTLAFIILIITGNQISVMRSISFLLLGIFLGTTIVIPFHELLHGIAYKIEGAPKVSYHSSLSQMMFYAAADKFVINSKAFFRVAMAPFIVISFIALMVFLNAQPSIRILSLGFFISHMIACAGDFSFVSFLERHKQRELYTYDDLDKAESYVFLRR